LPEKQPTLIYQVGLWQHLTEMLQRFRTLTPAAVENVSETVIP